MGRSRICVRFLLGLAIAWLLTFLVALCVADVADAALTLAFPIMLIVVEPDAVTIGIAGLLLAPFVAALASLSVALVWRNKAWLIAAMVLSAMYAALALLICVVFAVAADNPV